VSAALADVLDATATALRSFAGAAGDARTHTGRAADEGDPGDGDPPPVVQRIEIA
jgi:hypothetical protein